jgi:hypothetical protein
MTEALLLLVKISVSALILAIGMGATLADLTAVWLQRFGSNAYVFSLVVTSSLLAIVVVPAWVALLAWHFDVSTELAIVPGHPPRARGTSRFLVSCARREGIAWESVLCAHAARTGAAAHAGEAAEDRTGQPLQPPEQPIAKRTGQRGQEARLVHVHDEPEVDGVADQLGGALHTQCPHHVVFVGFDSARGQLQGCGNLFHPPALRDEP